MVGLRQARLDQWCEQVPPASLLLGVAGARGWLPNGSVAISSWCSSVASISSITRNAARGEAQQLVAGWADRLQSLAEELTRPHGVTVTVMARDRGLVDAAAPCAPNSMPAASTVRRACAVRIHRVCARGRQSVADHGGIGEAPRDDRRDRSREAATPGCSPTGRWQYRPVEGCRQARFLVKNSSSLSKGMRSLRSYRSTWSEPGTITRSTASGAFARTSSE